MSHNKQGTSFMEKAQIYRIFYSKY